MKMASPRWTCAFPKTPKRRHAPGESEVGGCNIIANGPREFAQTLTLLGEAEKAENILEPFVGERLSLRFFESCAEGYSVAEPSEPNPPLTRSPKLLFGECVVSLHANTILHSPTNASPY